MCQSCNSAAFGSSTVVRGDGGIGVAGSGTPTDPYIITAEESTEDLSFTVRDSDTVNLQLTGSGTTTDPFVLRADTSSASNLRSLGDVASTPAFTQGAVPMWIGQTAGGHFEARTPGTRYTTNATRGNGLYQGEIIRETDTQKRYEWDGSQWLSLDVTIPSFALDPTVLQNAGTVTSATDWNSLNSKSGIYRVSAGITTTNNGPQNAYPYGTLEVLMSGNSVTHNYYAHTSALIYTRTKWNASDWSAWNTLVAQSGLDQQLSTAVNTEANARIASDQNLINDYRGRDDSLVNQIQAEANARTSQDNNLLTNINSRATYDYVNGVQAQFDQGRLDGRYYTQGSINTNFAWSPPGQKARIWWGTGVVNATTFDSTSGTYFGVATIDFSNAGFNSTPYIAPTTQSADSGHVSIGVYDQPKSTSATLIVRRRNASATGFYYIAVGTIN